MIRDTLCKEANDEFPNDRFPDDLKTEKPKLDT